MKRSITLVGVMASILCSAAAAGAATWYVHPDSALSSIQAGLDSCSSGDIVLVAPGTYYENIIWPGTDDIHLLSDRGWNQTAIDGGSAGSVIRLLSDVGTATLIRGFTIRSGSSGYGGGIYCDAAGVRIEDNMICNNVADTLGGGIWVVRPELVGNTITNNWADVMGGGVYCEGALGTVNGNTITSNWADRGGGVYFYYADVTFCGNFVAGNTAACGAGLFYERSSAPTSMNTISGNSAGSDGGGIYCLRSSPAIRDNQVVGNSADGLGGGIFGLDMHPNFPLTINYNNIEGNTNYGIYNADPSRIIEAEFNWWGDTSGPFHPVTNPTGQGDRVSDYVDYGPWLGQPFVSEGETEGESKKQEARLMQSYPNPFGAGGTVISFNVERSTCNVSLRVYDVSGRLVRTLIDDRPISSFRFSSAGGFASGEPVSVVWDGRDEAGTAVSGGVYFYRLQAGGFTAAKKLIVLR